MVMKKALLLTSPFIIGIGAFVFSFMKTDNNIQSQILQQNIEAISLNESYYTDKYWEPTNTLCPNSSCDGYVRSCRWVIEMSGEYCTPSGCINRSCTGRGVYFQ